MMRTIVKTIFVCLALVLSLSSYAQSAKKSRSGAVLGSEIAPRDTTTQNRFTNRLIIQKGEWQCGIMLMYADFDSANSDYMLALQGLTAKASILRFAPEAAFAISDNHAVGVRFQYTKANGLLESMTADILGNMNFSIENLSAGSSSISANVFYRTYFGLDKRGRFGIFWDYVLGYMRGKSQFASSNEPSPYTFKQKGSLGFAPGVVYFPMNNISIQACISLVDLSYNHVRAYNADSELTGIRTAWRVQSKLNALNLSFGLTLHL